MDTATETPTVDLLRNASPCTCGLDDPHLRDVKPVFNVLSASPLSTGNTYYPVCPAPSTSAASNANHH